MNPIRKAYYILRYLGPRVVWLRAGVYASKLSGRACRVFASRPWETLTVEKLCRPGTPTEAAAYGDWRKARGPKFLFPLGRPPLPTEAESGAATRRPAFGERLAALREMRCVYMFREASPERIDWYRNPFDGTRSDPAPLWCRIPAYLPEQGDPRMMWEPGRAAWALDWALAAARGEADAADGLWRWIDSWMEACPPYHGYHWWCGQEASVRLLAILAGAWACGELDGERWLKLLRLAWATGYRVARHINYAISQKNNHAISEALGLMLVGHLFPELRESRRWFALGRRVMARELRRQCYADGSYVQSSMNYHRVMLEGAMLGTRVAELAGAPMERDIYGIIGRAAEFLYQMTDPHNGRTPNYGNNDGAHIFPVSECDFRDMRPAAQAAYFLANRRRLLPPGPWDGELSWLMGAEAAEEAGGGGEAAALESRAFEDGGYYTLRDSAADTWIMTRCHRYRDRMSQCDMMHVDLWAGGVNWLRDGGTYRYYLPGREKVERYFASQAAHNVLQIDGRDGAEKVGRFLLFPWADAECEDRTLADGAGGRIDMRSHDYERAPWRCGWKRSVRCLGGGLWAVIDEVLGEGEHTIRWWWHLCAGDHELMENDGGRAVLLVRPEEGDGREGSVAVMADGGGARAALITAGEARRRFEAAMAGDEDAEPQGIVSPYYGFCEFVPVLQVDWAGKLPVRCVTLVHTRGMVDEKMGDREPIGAGCGGV